MGKEVLGKWGLYLLAPQILFAIMVYGTISSLGVDIDAAEFALATAGIVATVCIFSSAWESMEIGVAIAASSLAGVLAIFCLLVPVYLLAGICGLFVFAFSFLAAKAVKREGARETVSLLVLGALPVVGALWYISDELRKERKAT